MSHRPELASSIQEDPFDVLGRMVPRHVWLSLAIVTMTVVAGLLLFDPQRPAAADTADETGTLEGKVVQILSEERLQGEESGEATYIQTVLVEITRGEQRGEQVQIRNGEQTVLVEDNRVRPGDRVWWTAPAARMVSMSTRSTTLSAGRPC